jgi:lipopolysaccharide biosynthesis protein
MAPTAEAGPAEGARVRGPIGPENRAVVFGVRASGRFEETSALALRALRGVAGRIVLLHPGPVATGVRAQMEALADRVIEIDGDVFTSKSYAPAVDEIRRLHPRIAEIVLTGDSWFGPVADLGPVVDRMAATDADVWDLLPAAPPREAFPEEGFPAVVDRPWFFLAVRRRFFDSDTWREWWSGPTAPDEREGGIVERAERAGFVHVRAFDTHGLHAHDPGLFAPEDLLDKGVPLVDRAVLTSYPPFLDRFAVIGYEIAEMMADRGYPLGALRSSLASCVPPKALVSILGLLSVLSDETVTPDAGSTLSIAVVVHVSDIDEIDDILRRLQFLPPGASVFVTTTEGVTAARLERLLEAWAGTNEHSYELRVTPQSPGRDMADFFVGCRDVIQSDAYDLVVKLHMRRAPWKTMNRLRYFRRYQLDNLLSSPGYVRNLLALFDREPELGLVFPPMIHIGYATMGRGWAMLQPHAERLAKRLDIRVPLDTVSPLAPYGGMWVGRPAAFRVMMQRRWTFADYDWKYQRRFGHLAHLQERLVSAAAAEAGFTSRTVLNYTHAEIGYTALEYKVDQMFSTTRGWPVEQIRFFHRAGYTGYGGTVALIRMYLRTNHPRVVDAFRPFYRVALRGHRVVAAGQRMASRLRSERGEKQREAAS